MPAGRSTRGRPRGALFVGFGLAALLPAVVFAACPADRVDRRVAVEYVHDGDTVRIEGGGPVRLIGLDTPELARDRRPAEPLAQAARDRLRELLRASGMQLALRQDTEREDRYGRLLAHAFLPDGRNVTELLLEAGLATALTVPPNDWQWRCYRAAERRARAAGIGVWTLPGYRVRNADELGDEVGATVLLHGRVVAVQPRRSGTRLQLAGGLVLWIRHEDGHRFPSLESYLGRGVEVRGRVRRWRQERQINVRHPAALELLE